MARHWHGWNGRRRLSLASNCWMPDACGRSRPWSRAKSQADCGRPRKRGWTIGPSGPALAIALQKAGGRLLTNEAVVRIERRDEPGGHRPYTLRALSRRCRSSWRRAPGAVCWNRTGRAHRPGQRPDDRCWRRRRARCLPDPVIWGNGDLCRAARPSAGRGRHGGGCRLRYRGHRRGSATPCAPRPRR